MSNNRFSAHAKRFAEHLRENRDLIHSVLRKYQSFEVVEDEIERSLDVLDSIADIGRYQATRVVKTSVFLPLNLPLYSYVIFAVVPSYQSGEVVVRPPERMRPVFSELSARLGFSEYFPNIHVYTGLREEYLNVHCKSSSVVVFTGKYENFLKIREACGRHVLLLYNGVGHNPLVVTETANIDLAVDKAIYVKLFNNGQDCAGPDEILVHASIADEFQKRLTSALDKVSVGRDYGSDNTRVGPLFEPGSLGRFSGIIDDTTKKGGEIVYGGVVEYRHNLVWPTVVRNKLSNDANYEEIYSPLFILTEYRSDEELAHYFDGPNQSYAQKQMYVSVFGRSAYLERKLPASILIYDMTIHDVERGNEEYGGFGPGASAVSYKGLLIFKPILVPREIASFLDGEIADLLSSMPKGTNPERYLVEQLFSLKVREIFSSDLVFGYIFGSYARNRQKSYSDIDMLICVKKKDKAKSKEFIEWALEMSEIIGKIPDFEYPVEIVTLAELEKAVEGFSTLSLSSKVNPPEAYDSMIWLHSLSHYKAAVINGDAIPANWEKVFPANSPRILKGFIADLRGNPERRSILARGLDTQDIPEDEAGLDKFIRDLGNGRRLIAVLRYISFEDRPLYEDIVKDMLAKRSSFGRRFVKRTFMRISKEP